MRTETIWAVKAQLHEIVGALTSKGAVLITRNGRPCAVLIGVTDETDLEPIITAERKQRTRSDGRFLADAD